MVDKFEVGAIIFCVFLCSVIAMGYKGGDIELFPPSKDFPTGLQLEYYDAQGDLDRVSWESSQTSCQGIEDFYTGNGFLEDWTRMEHTYSGVFQGGGGVMPPSAMLPDNGYDCSSFSHASRCLGDLYSLDCEFYYKGHYGKIVPSDAVNHIGICCETVLGWRCD